MFLLFFFFTGGFGKHDKEQHNQEIVEATSLLKTIIIPEVKKKVF